MKRNVILISLALVLFGAVMRILPHLPNMTPVTAIALVGALYVSKRSSILLPIAAVVISDLIIGFYDWRIMASVYASFLVVGFVGQILRRYPTIFAVGLLVFASSAIFFFITNTAVWIFSPWYAKDLSGLLYSYELGIPFWRNMLAGDLLYTAMLALVFEVSIYSATQSSFRELLSRFCGCGRILPRLKIFLLGQFWYGHRLTDF